MPNTIESTAKLKKAVFQAVEDAVHLFEEETGVTPSDIHLDFVDITQSGYKVRRFAIGTVTVRFQL